MRSVIVILALGLLGLGACSSASQTSAAAPAEAPAVAAAPITARCGGGFTGGVSGVTIRADDHVIRWSQPSLSNPRTETDLGPNPALAADIRRRLDRIGFADIEFNEPGNMTCALTAGEHTVAWPFGGEARVPSGVAEIHGLVQSAQGGE